MAFLRFGDAFAVMASNAGNDRHPDWWLNLRAQPKAEILAGRTHYEVIARSARPEEDRQIWEIVATLNPGFDEYRRLTARRIPVVLLEPVPPAVDAPRG